LTYPAAGGTMLVEGLIPITFLVTFLIFWVALEAAELVPLYGF
jgi:hypothetical protein